MNKAVLCLILCVIILSTLLGVAINEEQQETWNHFWGITAQKPAAQDAIPYGRIPSDEYDSVAAQKAVIENIKYTYFPIYDELMKYELKGRPFKGPYGETQFEFALRKYNDL